MPTKTRQRKLPRDRFPSDKATLLDKRVPLTIWQEHKLRCWMNAGPA